jgi:hypothetical protein
LVFERQRESTVIEFKDGLNLDNNGELRVEEHDGQHYVLGDGICLPVAGEAEGLDLIRSIESSEVYLKMKVFKSPGARAKVEAMLTEADEREKPEEGPV